GPAPPEAARPTSRSPPSGSARQALPILEARTPARGPRRSLSPSGSSQPRSPQWINTDCSELIATKVDELLTFGYVLAHITSVGLDGHRAAPPAASRCGRGTPSPDGLPPRRTVPARPASAAPRPG